MRAHLVLLVALLLLGCRTLPAPRRISIVQDKTPYADSYLFGSSDSERRPGVFILHGSGGGALHNMWVHAMYFASQGYRVMTYCWFDCGRDPLTEPAKPIAEVDLKRTAAALAWFSTAPGVDASRLAVYGVSRGAEQALLLGALQDRFSPAIRAIAVHAPSDVIVGGFSPNWLDRRCWTCATEPCEQTPANWNPRCGDINAGYADPFHIPAWTWGGTPLVTGERIAIERFSGPVFISAGSDDKVWSVERTRQLELTLRQAGRDVEVHVFPGEGHGFSTAAEQRRRELVVRFFDRVLARDAQSLHALSARRSGCARTDQISTNSTVLHRYSRC